MKKTLLAVAFLASTLMAQTTLFTQPQVTVPAGETVRDFTFPALPYATIETRFNIALADLQDPTKSFAYEIWVLDTIGGTEQLLFTAITWVGGHLNKNGVFSSPVDSFQPLWLAGKPVRLKQRIITNPILMGYTIVGIP